jgi:hypothetical protein
MKTLRITFITTLLIFLAVAVFAQDTAPSQPKAKVKTSVLDRFAIGGYLGVQFGTVTDVDISPVVTYRVLDPLYVGVGFTYIYYNDKRYIPDYSTNSIGGKFYVRYFLWHDLFAQAEYDPINLSYYDYYYDNTGLLVRGTKHKLWVNDMLIGAGYRQWLGQKSYATIMVFYNVNETNYSPYRNPIIRIGFGFGL